MKETLLEVYAAVKPYVEKLYGWSPFVAGLLLGYFGKPVIQWLVGLVF